MTAGSGGPANLDEIEARRMNAMRAALVAVRALVKGLRERVRVAELAGESEATYAAEVVAERDAARAAVERVRELHGPETIDVTAYECALGDCDHDDECPTVETQVCRECFGRVRDFEPEVYTGDDLEWPCATVRALDPGAEPGEQR